MDSSGIALLIRARQRMPGAGRRQMSCGMPRPQARRGAGCGGARTDYLTIR
ncbi:MAG: hypothetical protein ACLU38_09205 [Dysosmobacter sp.]